MKHEEVTGRDVLDPTRYSHVVGIPEVTATVNGAWVPVSDLIDFSFAFHPFDLQEAKYQCLGVARSFFMWQSVEWVCAENSGARAVAANSLTPTGPTRSAYDLRLIRCH